MPPPQQRAAKECTRYLGVAYIREKAVTRRSTAREEFKNYIQARHA